MGEWIALIDIFIWPLFLAVILFCFRGFLKSVFKSIQKRIEAGDEFIAGPHGIAFGKSEDKLTRNEEVKEMLDKTIFATDAQIEIVGINEKGKLHKSKDTPEQLKKVIYLNHKVSAPHIDTDGVERRYINVIVDADSENLLDKIERVIYHLHPTYRNPVRESTDRGRYFLLNTEGWGEFNIFADVYFKGYENPIRLFRYINFPNH